MTKNKAALSAAFLLPDIFAGLNRGIVIFLLAFVGGPALGLLVLMAGCWGSSPLLGAMCGHNAAITLPLLTIAFWFLIGMLLAAILFWRDLREK